MSSEERELSVEAPSGKSVATENFPVASILIRDSLRPHVRCFYAFARAADDVADAPHLSEAEKLRRLDIMEAALLGEPDPRAPAASAMAHSLAVTGIGPQHCRDLLAAFRLDASQSAWPDWDALMHYCRLSAVPVGRQLLTLHGEQASAEPASDALCSALQILNHVQDCGEDHRFLGRVYLPRDRMSVEGAEVEQLSDVRLSPALRRVVDDVLDRTSGLIDAAWDLPLVLRDRRLRMEAAVILDLARGMLRQLRHQDPLAAKVKPGRIDFARAALFGIGRGLFARSRA